MLILTFIVYPKRKERITVQFYLLQSFRYLGFVGNKIVKASNISSNVCSAASGGLFS